MLNIIPPHHLFEMGSVWDRRASIVKKHKWTIIYHHRTARNPFERDICPCDSEFFTNMRGATLFDTEEAAWEYVREHYTYEWFLNLPCFRWLNNDPDEAIRTIQHTFYSYGMHKSAMFIFNDNGIQTFKIWLKDVGTLRAVGINYFTPAVPRHIENDAAARIER